MTAEAIRAKPTIFMLPGLRGERGLAGFLERLGDRIDFQVIDHPDLSAPVSELLDMRQLGGIAAERIARAAPAGALMLAGVSFGGGVAFEAARRLLAEGRSIAALLIIDAPFDAAARRRAGKGSAWPRAAARELLRIFTGMDATRRALLWSASRLGPAQASQMEWFLMGFLRRQTIDNWAPGPLRPEPPMTAFVSEEFASASGKRIRLLAPHARIIDLPGGHLETFKPASLDILSAAFDEVLAGQVGGDRGLGA